LPFFAFSKMCPVLVWLSVRLTCTVAEDPLRSMSFHIRARYSSTPGCGRGWQSSLARQHTAVLRFSLNGAGEVGHLARTKDPQHAHRRHDELVSELGGWYTRSVPEMGFYVEERRFGFYLLQKDTGRERAPGRSLSFLGLHRRDPLAKGIQERPGQGAEQSLEGIHIREEHPL
jgi:hypothetical protein